MSEQTSRVDRSLRIKPHAYLEAIMRRAKKLDGVNHVRFGGASHYQAWFTIVFDQGGAWEPSDELRHAVDSLRREFAAAFLDWGITVRYKRRHPVKIKRVERSYIVGTRVYQDLECGHKVEAERLKSRRQCSCCASSPSPASRPE